MGILGDVRVEVAHRLRDLAFRGFTAQKGRGKAVWHARKAWEQIGRKDWREAVFFAQIAIACDPTLPTGYLMLGLAYRLSGETGKARQALEEGIRTAPDDPHFFEYLGDLETQLQRWPEAESAYRRALDARPDNPELQHKLALAIQMQGRLEEALPLLESAVKGAPDNGLMLYALGEVRLLVRDAQGAVFPLTEATERGFSSPWAYYYLGYALGAVGQWKEALQHVRKAVEMEPDEEGFRSLLGAVEANIEHNEKGD